MASEQADYGFDAPGVVLALAGVSAAMLALRIAGAQRGVMFPAASFGLSAAGMVFSSRIGKLKQRDRMLDALGLAGDERVLDVGCGRGLLLIGAAKRVPRGRAVGVDLWLSRDQSGNAEATTRRNAEVEGVADRVELHTGDMARLPFDDASFDAVVSSWAIHNVPRAADRDAAVREIARVLRPGGRVQLLDLRFTRRYAELLREAGLEDVRVSGPTPWLFPPSWVVSGRRPAS